MSGWLRWELEGQSWPLRETSRCATTPRLAWRVQQAGNGPAIVLLHGTGASAHSWRGVIPLLAERFTVIAPDLPGHAFTRGEPAGGLTLAGMACALRDLLAELQVDPQLVVGHSAGAAIALQHALETGSTTPIMGFNPAIMPFPGAAAHIFPTMAKLLFVNPFVPRIFARLAQVPGETERFLRRSTGSRIEPAGLRCYELLFGNHRHCDGALQMMANWQLEALCRRLPEIAAPVQLVHTSGDKAVNMASVERACALLPDCTLVVPGDLGHLFHEEDPAAAAELIRQCAAGHPSKQPAEAAS